VSGTRRGRKSVSASEEVTVSLKEVYVSVEGVDANGIGCSFSVHLLKDGQRIASRFFLRPSGGRAHPGDEMAHFDFRLPIGVVADGKLRVEIEPSEQSVARKPVNIDELRQPTLRVYLLLQSD
jgi:hypothetical protein